MTQQPDELRALLSALAIAAAVMAYVWIRYRALASRRPKGRWRWGLNPLRWGRDSAVISRAGPSADFCKEFEAILTNGSSVIMPAGDGRYPEHLTQEKKGKWFRALHAAVKRGASIDLLVTSPRCDTRQIWDELVVGSNGRFRLITIDKEKLPNELRVEAERLDTFHPVLFYQGKFGDKHVMPLGMWIESYHPLGQCNAFGIEVVGEKSVKEDPRFGMYRTLLRALIESPAATVHVGAKAETCSEMLAA